MTKTTNAIAIAAAMLLTVLTFQQAVIVPTASAVPVVDLRVA